jgi:hypothetical protein
MIDQFPEWYCVGKIKPAAGAINVWIAASILTVNLKVRNDLWARPGEDAATVRVLVARQHEIFLKSIAACRHKGVELP